MKKYVMFLAFILAIVVTVIAMITVADSIKFFHPGVPYSAKVHHAMVCGVIISTMALVNLAALLTMVFLRDTDISPRSPQE